KAVVFSKEQSHQMHDVLRLRVGDSVRVFDGLEPVDHVVVLTDVACGRIEGSQAQPAEPRTSLVAYPALLQRDKFETVLQKLTEVGVAAVVPVITARSVVRDAPDERRQSRWRSILREAAEQCGRGVVPELRAALSFGEAITTAAAASTVILAYEGERRRTLKHALQDRPTMV